LRYAAADEHLSEKVDPPYRRQEAKEDPNMLHSSVRPVRESMDAFGRLRLEVSEFERDEFEVFRTHDDRTADIYRDTPRQKEDHAEEMEAVFWRGLRRDATSMFCIPKDRNTKETSTVSAKGKSY
jgi:hypothetical protein